MTMPRDQPMDSIFPPTRPRVDNNRRKEQNYISQRVIAFHCATAKDCLLAKELSLSGTGIGQNGKQTKLYSQVKTILKKLFYSFCDSQKERERESLKIRNMKFSKRPRESTSSLINRTATESTGKSICTNYFTFSIGVYIR